MAELKKWINALMAR